MLNSHTGADTKNHNGIMVLSILFWDFFLVSKIIFLFELCHYI